MGTLPESPLTPGPLLQPIELAPGALLSLHAAFPQRYPALLESAASGAPLGRFDILFAEPGAELTLWADGTLTGPGASAGETFLATLDRWWLRERSAPPAQPLPFSGGWLLYLGYELAGQIEPRLRLPLPVRGPLAHAVRIPAAVIRQHDTGKAWIVAEAGAAASLGRIEADLRECSPAAPLERTLLREGVQEEDPAHYLAMIERALGHIAAGDVYQANLSRAWFAALGEGIEPHHLYQRLRETNPGPFSGIVRLPELAIVSSSPERLVEVRDGMAATRPIAGTRPRGRDGAADTALARELHAHPKERAEHVMLIDLERNDLGRVCEPGTVQVDEYMAIESYAHVHHIVSNIRGRLRADATPGRVLAAIFPGGTITGCPKVRCMQLIAALEQVARGAYTGSLGYLNRDGSMDLNILIRSLAIEGRQLTLRAGAGIVADSVAERELDETRAKARGVLRALGAAA